MTVDPEYARCLQPTPENPFPACDGGDPGTPERPSIWVFGLEPGYSKRDEEADVERSGSGGRCSTYSVTLQFQWPYNRNCFKLLSAIAGLPIEDYSRFACDRCCFEKGSTGYFKGNLYPEAFNRVSSWPDWAQRDIASTRAEYQEWCRNTRFPEIALWVAKFQPKLFIGVGVSYRQDFAAAVYGRHVDFQVKRFCINGHMKSIFYVSVTASPTPLFVVPHLSGGSRGLNSNDAIRKAGDFIRSSSERFVAASYVAASYVKTLSEERVE